MLLHNVYRYRVPSALIGQPTLDNVFTSKKKKKAKAAKVGVGPYGGIYSPVNTDTCSGDSDSGGSDGGDGGGDGGA